MNSLQLTVIDMIRLLRERNISYVLPAHSDRRWHTCVLLDNSAVKCWGKGAYGQLGQGNTDYLGDNANEMGDNLPAIDL